MRGWRRAGHDREIFLGRDLPLPGIEVIEFPAPEGAPRPRLFRALDELPEPAYRPPSDDPIGSAGLWRALESL